MVAAGDLLTLENPVFKAYLFWGAVLVLKLMAMALLTARQRMKKRVFISPEDCIHKSYKVKTDDPDVERVRRAHLNDLENLLPFFIIGLMYVMINPSSFIAINLFRVAALARIVHTVVYAVVVVPQPSRALAFFAAYGATAYMAVQVLLTAL